MASLFKSEILEALSRGEAVNLFDLGTLYIKASGKVTGSTPETANIPGFQVKFTPSKIANEAVSSIGIKKIVIADTKPKIDTMTDLYSEEITTNFTSEKSIRIEGSRLKIGGEEGGVFFSPITENGEADKNESNWIKVQRLIHNSSKNLEFFLPSELEAEKEYSIILKTNKSIGSFSKKSYSVIFSTPVSVKSA